MVIVSEYDLIENAKKVFFCRRQFQPSRVQAPKNLESCRRCSWLAGQSCPPDSKFKSWGTYSLCIYGLIGKNKLMLKTNTREVWYILFYDGFSNFIYIFLLIGIAYLFFIAGSTLQSNRIRDLFVVGLILWLTPTILNYSDNHISSITIAGRLIFFYGWLLLCKEKFNEGYLQERKD